MPYARVPVAITTCAAALSNVFLDAAEGFPRLLPQLHPASKQAPAHAVLPYTSMPAGPPRCGAPHVSPSPCTAHVLPPHTAFTCRVLLRNSISTACLYLCHAPPKEQKYVTMRYKNDKRREVRAQPCSVWGLEHETSISSFIHAPQYVCTTEPGAVQDSTRCASCAQYIAVQYSPVPVPRVQPAVVHPDATPQGAQQHGVHVLISQQF